MRRRYWAALVAAGFLVAGVSRADQAPPASVDSAIIQQAVERVLASWNTPTLSHWLAPDFDGRDELLATLSFDVPPTARLRILGIGAIQTLEQERQGPVLLSLVSVTVRAQAEWDDPRNGLQRREGTAEYVLRISREVPR